MSTPRSKVKQTSVLLARPAARHTEAALGQRSVNWQQPRAHGALAGRSSQATAGSAGNMAQALLQMQRQSGNRSVQRALGLAPQGRRAPGVPPAVARRIQLERGGGQALDRKVRNQMQRVLGADFHGVRVHTGAEADALNRQLHARAFTTGRDIFFRQGAYNPESTAGRELIAHELTHVLHQGNHGADPSLRKMSLGQPGDRFEREANQVAQAMAQQERQGGQPAAAGQTAQRQAEDEKKAVQTQPEEDKDQQVQAKAEEEDKVQAQLAEDKDKKVQSQAEEEDKVQTQPEEDKVQTQPEEDKDETVQAQAEEEKDKIAA